MVKGLKSFERIQELLGELEAEMGVFFQSKEEHYDEIGEANLFGIDVHHLIENVSLSASESARLVSQFREVLRMRREMKMFMEMHASTQNELRVLRRSLEKAKELMYTTKEGVDAKNDSYRVRTEGMINFLDSIPNLEKRSRVNLVEVTNKELEKGLESKVEKKKEEVKRVPKPVSSPAPSQKVQGASCQLQKHKSKWLVRSDGATLFETSHFDEAIDYVMESNYQNVLVSPEQRAVVKKTLERRKAKLKKGKTYAYAEKLNEFHSNLSA